MGEWHKVEPRRDPCATCESSWGNVSSEVRNGELWTKSEHCSENCEKLREHYKEVGE